MVLSKQQCGSQPCAQAFGGLLGSCETAWENVPRRLFSVFLLAGGLREVIAPHQAASWPQLQHNNSSSRGSPCRAMLDGRQLGHGAARPQGSVRPAHSRQQFLMRNHAVTEPGGAFQLGK